MRWAVGILAAGLIVGFVLCAVSELNFSDILKESGIMALGFSWMIGYSLHGVPWLLCRSYFWSGIRPQALNYLTEHTGLAD
jgi:hypothetical protein